MLHLYLYGGIMARKKDIDVTILSSGVAVTKDHKRYVFSNRNMDYHNNFRYNLCTRIISKDDLKIYREGDIYFMSPEIKRIKTLEGYYFSLLFVAIALLHFHLKETTTITAVQNIPWYLWIGLALVFLTPNFYFARDTIFDLLAHLYHRDDRYFRYIYRFRAAVNCVMNAYRKLEKVPTLEEARTQSIVCKKWKKIYVYYMGITFFIAIFLMIHVIMHLSKAETPGIIIIYLIGFELMAFLLYFDEEANILEFYTLMLPTNEDINMVIDALAVLETLEEDGKKAADDLCNVVNKAANARSAHVY